MIGARGTSPDGAGRGCRVPVERLEGGVACHAPFIYFAYMPEAFSNRYTFPSREAVPGAEAVRAALAEALGGELTLKSHPAGEHGAHRAWTEMEGAGGLSAWAFWEAERPEVEVTVTEPMARMLAVNAAMARLGGAPAADDAAWRRRMAHRRLGRIVAWARNFALAGLAALAIWAWGWWGVAIVIVTMTLGAILWTVALARAFARG